MTWAKTSLTLPAWLRRLYVASRSRLYVPKKVVTQKVKNLNGPVFEVRSGIRV